MADAQELWVWMNGEHVGAWQRARGGAHRFVYEASWLSSPRVRPLSISVPITPDRTMTSPAVGNFFDNLLPDSDAIRRRIAARFRTPSTDAFELLQAIGRDCVGAVQLLPPGVAPEGFDRLVFERLNEAAVARQLERAVQDPRPGVQDEVDDLRISIAGAQEKTALLKVDGRWARPLGATPTTHILKLPIGLVGGRRLDLTHSVQNEWLCAQWLRELGLPVARTDMASFEGQDVLVVERFDRAWATHADEARWITRLPQEDFCQALGVPPHQKYESEGGPGMAAAQRLLLAGDSAAADITRFLCTQLAFWLLAATDGHAKNFSLFLLPGGGYRMTPLYDVMSVWPVVGKGPNHVHWKEARLAMAVRSRNAHYRIADIHPRHWKALAERSGVDGVWGAMGALVQRAELAVQAVESQLPAGFPERTAATILAGVLSQCKVWKQAERRTSASADGSKGVVES